MLRPFLFRAPQVNQTIQMEIHNAKVRDSRMNSEFALLVILFLLLIFFSVDFKKQYTKEFHEAARNPFIRFLSGLVVVFIASFNPILASIVLSIVFFWIADVNLLSTIVL
jgi:uncharacterized membrane protein